MSRFVLPTFIAPVSIWRSSNWAGTVPPANPPDVEVMCNLTPGRRVFEESVNPTSYILIPKETDIRYSESGIWTAWPPTDPDLVEVPTGSGHYYTVADVERVALGFANEHLEAAITKSSDVVTPPPPPPFTIVDALDFQQLAVNPLSMTMPLSAPTDIGTVILVTVVADASGVFGLNDDGGTSYTLIGSSTNTTDCWLSVFMGIASAPVSTITLFNVAVMNVSIGIQTYIGPLSGITVHNSGTNFGTGGTIAFGPTGPLALDLQLICVGTNPGTDFLWTVPGPFDGGPVSFDDGSLGFPGMLMAFSANDAVNHSGTVGLSVPLDWCLAWITLTA